jgi:hypothetical protein
VLGVDGPEQRQIIAPVPGRHGLALPGQGRDAALLREQRPDSAPESGIGVFRLRRLQHLAEDTDQGFLGGLVPLVQDVEPLLGRGLGPSDAAQHHLGQLVAAAPAGLAQQGEQQRVPPARLGDVEEVADLQRRGLGGELAQLGVGDALQERIGVDQAAEPVEAVGPEADRLRRRGPGRLLQAVEAGHRVAGRLGQEGIQHRRGPGREVRRDAAVHAPVNLGAQPVHQPVEGAERWQVDRGRLQRLDRPVDEVGGGAHGLGRLKDGADDQALGRVVVRRDREVGPHRGLVAVQRLGPAHLVGPGLRYGDAELRRQVGHGAGVDLVRGREAPELAARLEQHRQQQATLPATGGGADEGEIGVGQAVSPVQFLLGQPRARARVSGAVDGRHAVSGKGCAEAAGRGM